MKHNNVKRIDSVLIRNRVTVIGLAVKVKQIKTMELKVTAMFFTLTREEGGRMCFSTLSSWKLMIDVQKNLVSVSTKCLFYKKRVKTRIHINLHKRKNETFEKLCHSINGSGFNI